MSAVRDLRELVNVSRLTFQDSSDDDYDDYTTENLNGDFKLMLDKSIYLNNPIRENQEKKQNFALPTPPSSASSLNAGYSVDNKRTKTVSSETNQSHKQGIVLPVPVVPLVNSSAHTLVPAMIMSPVKMLDYENAKRDVLLLNSQTTPLVTQTNKKKPLPPLKERMLDVDVLPNEADMNADDSGAAETKTQLRKSTEIITIEGNFDHVLTYIDVSVVSDWLNLANVNLQTLSTWLEKSKCESFVHFANFWLTMLSDKQRRNLVDMEYSIIVDEICMAFNIGLNSDKVECKDVKKIIKIALSEYPLALNSSHGSYLVLDYLDILCSDRKDSYKKLLSDVKCRTANKQYAQWLLSIRSFALVNMFSAIVGFYDNISKGIFKCFRPIRYCGHSWLSEFEKNNALKVFLTKAKVI